jgi:hypothetical protein
VLGDTGRGHFSGPFFHYPGHRLLPAPLRAFVDFIKAFGDAWRAIEAALCGSRDRRLAGSRLGGVVAHFDSLHMQCAPRT